MPPVRQELRARQARRYILPSNSPADLTDKALETCWGRHTFHLIQFAPPLRYLLYKTSPSREGRWMDRRHQDLQDFDPEPQGEGSVCRSHSRTSIHQDKSRFHPGRWEKG